MGEEERGLRGVRVGGNGGNEFERSGGCFDVGSCCSQWERATDCWIWGGSAPLEGKRTERHHVEMWVVCTWGCAIQVCVSLADNCRQSDSCKVRAYVLNVIELRQYARLARSAKV